MANICTMYYDNVHRSLLQSNSFCCLKPSSHLCTQAVDKREQFALMKFPKKEFWIWHMSSTIMNTVKVFVAMAYMVIYITKIRHPPRACVLYVHCLYS